MTSEQENTVDFTTQPAFEKMTVGRMIECLKAYPPDATFEIINDTNGYQLEKFSYFFFSRENVTFRIGTPTDFERISK
jgi:hypothetical protein